MACYATEETWEFVAGWRCAPADPTWGTIYPTEEECDAQCEWGACCQHLPSGEVSSCSGMGRVKCEEGSYNIWHDTGASSVEYWCTHDPERCRVPGPEPGPVRYACATPTSPLPGVDAGTCAEAIGSAIASFASLEECEANCAAEEEEEEEEEEEVSVIDWKNCCCRESPCMKKVAVGSTGSTGNIDPTTGLPIGGWGGLPGGLPGMGGGGGDFEMVSVGAFGDLSCGCGKRLIGEMNSETDPFGTSEVCKVFKVNFIYNEGTHIDADFYIDALNDSFSDDTTDTSLYGDRKQKDTLIRFEKYKETVLTGGSAKIFEGVLDIWNQVLSTEAAAETHGFIRNVINIYFADFGTLTKYDLLRAAWAWFPCGGGEPAGFPTAGAIIFPTFTFVEDTSFKHGTMVHEMGHSFDLYHTFGARNIPCDDDEISDTPLTNLNWDRTRTADCGELSMNENWMDYAYGAQGESALSHDPDQFFFTKGQNDRMHGAIEKCLSTYYTNKFCKVIPCDPVIIGDCDGTPAPVDEAKVKLSWPTASSGIVGWIVSKDPNWYGNTNDTYPGHEGVDMSFHGSDSDWVSHWTSNGLVPSVPQSVWTDMVNSPVSVYAAAPGTVITITEGYEDQCDVRDAWGPVHGTNGTKCDYPEYNMVVIDHGATNAGYQYTSYIHLQKNSVTTAGISVGTVVTRGQRIGTVGSSGNSTWPHLHFEAHTSNSAVIDPFNLDPEKSMWKNQDTLPIYNQSEQTEPRPVKAK